MDPHWRATSCLWSDSKNADLYRKWLKSLHKEENRARFAFVFSREDKGAYIVYTDYGQRWDGSLCSGKPEDDHKVDMLCHEIGHLLTNISASNLPATESLYFYEQCGVLGGTMLKTAIGNKRIIPRDFPMLKAYQPAHVQENMDYDSFCIYTPSPLARYYETPKGHETGQSRFLSSSGIVRFDLIAEDLTKSTLHLRHHLSTMQLFGGIALELANNPSFADFVAQTIPNFAPIKKTMAHVAKDQQAKTILKHWWKAVQDVLGWKGSDVIQNLYVGEQEQFPSLHHANNYFMNLTTATQYAMTKRSNDCLLPVVYRSLAALMAKSAALPAITSKITAPQAPTHKPPAGGFWNRFKQRGA